MRTIKILRIRNLKVTLDRLSESEILEPPSFWLDIEVDGTKYEWITVKYCDGFYVSGNILRKIPNSGEVEDKIMDWLNKNRDRINSLIPSTTRVVDLEEINEEINL